MDIFTFILARNSAGGGGGSVKKGSAKTPYTLITANPSISVANGVITATVSQSKSITPVVKPGYVSSGTSGTVTVDGIKDVQAFNLEPNLREDNIKAGVSIFDTIGTYVGGDGGVLNGNVLLGKTNGYGIIVENVIGIDFGVVTSNNITKTDDGWLNLSTPATPSGRPYYFVVRPSDSNNTKIYSVTGNTGGTAYVSNTVAYVPVYSGDSIIVNLKDN